MKKQGATFHVETRHVHSATTHTWPLSAGYALGSYWA